MEYLSQVLAQWQQTLLWLAGLTVFFAVLAHFMPCNPGMAWWKDGRAVRTDAFYWFLMPLINQVLRVVLLLCLARLFFGPIGGTEVANGVMQGYGFFGSLALWQQALLILAFEDVILYAVHRFFHGKLMWKFHAVHHSPKTLDWMSTQRFHLVNNLLAFGLADTVMLLMGFSMQAIILLGPFNMFFSALVHANLNWTYGPFKYVLASPVFHRWHHTGVKAGGMRNFAPTFPVLDIIFGTFYMPKGQLPANFGVHDKAFPEDFLGQFFYPFKKSKK